MSLVITGLCAALVAALAFVGLGVRAAKRGRSELIRAATHDHVTGLINRDGLRSAIESTFGSNAPETTKGAVLAIEIDKLTSVNLTYGHEVGDALLGAITRQLTNALKPGEKLIRYSGPQFVVLCPDTSGSDSALERARDISRTLRVPFQIGVDQIRITPRTGVAVNSKSQDTPESLVTDALLAATLTDTKNSEAVSLFELAMRSRPSQILTEQRLHTALENDEFVLLFLPVVELDTNRIVGVEALLRWADPDRGMLAPAEFLDILESSGLMVPVGTWVFNEVCRTSVEWSKRFPDIELLTTLNISRSQLSHPDFVDMLIDAVQSADIPPDRLCLEVSEETLTHDVETTWTVLRRAKDAGFKLAIDDFGVGFSSLVNLRYFQLDILKVGSSFIDGLNGNRENEAIVQQLIALAHSLDIVPVAEGVESADQAQTLDSMQCNFAQGYWFSKPVPATTMEKLLERRKIRPGNERRSIDWTAGST